MGRASTVKLLVPGCLLIQEVSKIAEAKSMQREYPASDILAGPFCLLFTRFPSHIHLEIYELTGPQANNLTEHDSLYLLIGLL